MAKIRISLDYAGIGQLMRGEGMAAAVGEYGAAIASRAGSHYGFRVRNTGQRQAADVYTADREGVQDNYDNNTLLRALG